MVSASRNLFCRSFSSSSNFTKNCRSHPDEPDNAGHYAVGDLAGAGVVGEPQAKTTIDDPESNDDATQPEMGIRSCLATLMLLEESVVDEARDGLEEEEAEDDNTDDRVVVC